MILKSESGGLAREWVWKSALLHLRNCGFQKDGKGSGRVIENRSRETNSGRAETTKE